MRFERIAGTQNGNTAEMFTKSVAWYDALYSWKDYEQEAERLRLFIDQHARRPVTTLLDVACGTGQHITFLKAHYARGTGPRL
jgi:ubiquinone/menaquinone biosynthesis C-methylase UbiE